MRAIEGLPPQREPLVQRPLADAIPRDAGDRPAPAAEPAQYPAAAASLASARSAFESHGQRVETARPSPAVERRPAEPDDLIAGLEAAALRDIGAEIGGAADETSDDDGQKREKRGNRRNKNKQAGEMAASAVAAVAAAGAADNPKRAERQERRAAKLKRQEGKNNGAALPAPTNNQALEKKKAAPARKRDKADKADKPRKGISAPREWGIPWTALSFLAMVVIPAAVAAFYYIVVASPQYQVETQFAVRGSSQSSMATMGLSSMLGGTTAQSGDSYIVASYVESIQLVRDVQQELGIDLRQFYTRDHIDWLYKIEPDLPLEKFTEYWQSMTDVSYNATTGNTTLLIYGFSAEDTKAIADAVLKVAERLVNELSESNRQQVMQVASKQVDRAEERLRKVQGEIRKLRVEEKVTDPATLISLQTQAISTLRSQLSTLETRYGALMKSVSPEAPQAKSLMKQIDSLKAQIAGQEAQLGNTTGEGKKDLSAEEKANLAEVLNKFEELTIEQTFATQAYTTALAAFETAIVEAQRQERYFATFVAPARPEIALYPLRYLDSFIAFLVLLAVWMVTQFIYRSFRDHAV
jgi:capsular polysaccharide transport system permease protein